MAAFLCLQTNKKKMFVTEQKLNVVFKINDAIKLDFFLSVCLSVEINFKGFQSNFKYNWLYQYTILFIVKNF